VAAFADIPAVAGKRAEPDVDDTGDSDNDVVVGEVLLNPEIAAELARFLVKLGTPGEWIGISAFTLFTLAFGVQVPVWFADQEHNVLHIANHTYWATSLTNAYFPNRSPYHAISCTARQVSIGNGLELSLPLENAGHSMNHWICGVREGSPEVEKHYPLLDFGDSDATTDLFDAYSAKGLCLIETLMDGNCGIDVFNMILGLDRTPANRRAIRTKLCEVALKSMSNRAFIWLMYNQGGISHHMGLNSLNGSFIKLMEMHGHKRVFKCNGVVVEVSHNGSGAPAVPQSGDCPGIEVTDEEVEAVTWKCGLHKMSPSLIKDMILQIGDKVMSDIVKQYNGRELAVPKTRPPRVILEDIATVKTRVLVHRTSYCEHIYFLFQSSLTCGLYKCTRHLSKIWFATM